MTRDDAEQSFAPRRIGTNERRRLSSIGTVRRQHQPARQPPTDRLLVPRTGTLSTEPLRLHAARVGDEQGAVVGDEDALELDRGLGVLVLAGVGDDRLGNGLTDGVDLAGVATASDADAHVDAGERVRRRDRLLQHEDRLVKLQSALRSAMDEVRRGTDRRISGSTRCRGWPLTRIRPRPGLQKATALRRVRRAGCERPRTSRSSSCHGTGRIAWPCWAAERPVSNHAGHVANGRQQCCAVARPVRQDHGSVDLRAPPAC